MQGIKKKDGLRHNASKIGLSKIHRRLILYRRASFLSRASRGYGEIAKENNTQNRFAFFGMTKV